MTGCRIAVLGAGGHAKVVVATAQAAGNTVVGLFDDDEVLEGSEILGIKVAGPIESVADCHCDAAVIAIGHNETRRRIVERVRAEWCSVIHPSALVHSSAEVGVGTVVFAGTVIQPDTVIGAHVIVNTGASVDHDCLVRDFVHIAPGVRIGGGVQIGEGTLLGIGAAVVPGVSIGASTVIGAGSVVISDVESGAIVAGVPARPIHS